jgi:phosphate:Na+ symporter
MVETMLAQARQAILQGQGGRHAELAAEAAALETLAVHIADYLGHIGREALDRESSTRQVELVHFVVNLRNAAEVLATSFADLGARRAQSGLALTPALAEELAGLFDRLGEALALAVAVLVDQDAPAARRLIAEKGRLRDQELQLSERLFDRLGAEGGENLQLAAYRLDVTRQAKRLTGHFASVAYSLLNASGELLPSRIRG